MRCRVLKFRRRPAVAQLWHGKQRGALHQISAAASTSRCFAGKRARFEKCALRRVIFLEFGDQLAIGLGLRQIKTA
jgi:hypothetical protein